MISAVWCHGTMRCYSRSIDSRFSSFYLAYRLELSGVVTVNNSCRSISEFSVKVNSS